MELLLLFYAVAITLVLIGALRRRAFYAQQRAEMKAARDCYAGSLVLQAKSHADHVKLHEELINMVRLLNDITQNHERRIVELETPWANN